MKSKYGRGQIEVLAHNSSTTPSSAYGADKASKDTPVLVAEACALVADAKSGSWSMNSTAAELGILAVSAGPDLEQASTFLGQDTSCPRTTATLFVPSKLSDIIIDAESKVVVAGEGLNARKIYAAGKALNFAASALDMDHHVTAAEASQYTVQSTAAIWTYTDAGELRISRNLQCPFANTNLIHGAKADAQCSKQHSMQRFFSCISKAIRPLWLIFGLYRPRRAIYGLLRCCCRVLRLRSYFPL